MTTPTGSTYPSLADWRNLSDDDRKARLLAALADVGARTTDCPCGYSPFDSCPVCD